SLLSGISMRRKLVMGDVDVSPILALWLTKEFIGSRAVAAGLFADLAHELYKRGIRPRALIYTYENQPWEKVMLLGFRRSLPETLLIGVQHAPLAEQYFSGHPSRLQWEDGTAPDVLVAMGEEFRGRLIDGGAPAERVVVGGALRFPSIRLPVGARVRV